MIERTLKRQRTSAVSVGLGAITGSGSADRSGGKRADFICFNSLINQHLPIAFGIRIRQERQIFNSIKSASVLHMNRQRFLRPGDYPAGNIPDRPTPTGRTDFQFAVRNAISKKISVCIPGIFSPQATNFSIIVSGRTFFCPIPRGFFTECSASGNAVQIPFFSGRTGSEQEIPLGSSIFNQLK